MTPVPGPLILLVAPLLAGVVVYLLRRWSLVATLLSTATTAVLMGLCSRLPLDRSAFVLGQEVAFGRPVVVAGRTLMLSPAGQAWLTFVLALATVLYLVAWRVPQGRAFIPASLGILSLYALVTLLQPFELATLAFAISVTLTVFFVRGDGHDSVRGVQRYLLVTLLAMPLLLAAAWLVDQSELQPENVLLVRRALLPAALGFGLMLAAFPFGTWMPALAADVAPVASAFIFTAGQAMAVLLGLLFLRGAPGILTDPVSLTGFQIAGLVMVVSGGGMAAVQRDFGRLFGYAALSDLGYLFLALGIGGSQGLTLMLLHMVNRAVAIVLLAAALAVVRHRTGTDRFTELAGMARRQPVSTGGLVLGILGLAGFPLTAGFGTHWAVSRALAGERWAWTLVLLASSTAILIGLLRGISAVLGVAAGDNAKGRLMVQQPRIASLMILGLAALATGLGFYPHLFLGHVEAAVRALALF